MIKQGTYKFFLLCLFLMLCIPSAFSGSDGPGCRWSVYYEHATVSCYEQDKIDQLTIAPIVISECASVSIVHEADQYYDLGCSQQGFNGYFGVENWELLALNNKGKIIDADQDNLVGNEEYLAIEAPPQTRQQLRIVVPVEGYLSFNERLKGSSFLQNKVFVNGKLLKNVFRTSKDGLFFSLLLKSGDELTIQFENADHTKSQFSLTEFRFLSNALGVVKRNWLAIGQNANIKRLTQFITIEKANIADVLIPEDLSEVKDFTPNKTGFPIMDEDGIHLTTDDQIELSKELTCQLNFEFEDEEHEEVSQNIVIHRVWSITDQCSGNLLREVQKLYKPKKNSILDPPKDYGGK